MCKKRNSRRINLNRKIIRVDHCLATLLRIMNDNREVKTLASCCGHGRYPPTIVLRMKGISMPFEVFSGKMFITKNKRFYKKDKEGFYYIPEIQAEL